MSTDIINAELGRVLNDIRSTLLTEFTKMAAPDETFDETSTHSMLVEYIYICRREREEANHKVEMMIKEDLQSPKAGLNQVAEDLKFIVTNLGGVVREGDSLAKLSDRARRSVMMHYEGSFDLVRGDLDKIVEMLEGNPVDDSAAIYEASQRARYLVKEAADSLNNKPATPTTELNPDIRKMANDILRGHANNIYKEAFGKSSDRTPLDQIMKVSIAIEDGRLAITETTPKESDADEELEPSPIESDNVKGIRVNLEHTLRLAGDEPRPDESLVQLAKRVVIVIQRNLGFTTETRNNSTADDLEPIRRAMIGMVEATGEVVYGSESLGHICRRMQQIASNPSKAIHADVLDGIERGLKGIIEDAGGTVTDDQTLELLANRVHMLYGDFK